MLMNNLDPEVAERPEDLVVYGGIGKAARNWECFDAIIETLKRSRMTKASRPVRQAGRRAQDPPRRAGADRELQPGAELGELGALQRARPQGPDDVRADDRGLVDLHRQPGHRAGHETFAEAGRKHYGGDWAGKWILTAGLGGMGGAQPLAATMAGASMLAVECDPSRIEMRLKSGYLDRKAASLDEAMNILANSSAPVSVGLLGNAAEVVPQFSTEREARASSPLS